MRKVLSFVLVLTLVLSSFSMAFAATPAAAGLSDIAGNANEEAIQVNYDLGIVTGNPDGTFLPGKAVTRAEFAAMITRALAIPDSALAGYTSTTFKDTVGYGWAVKYLAFAQSKGIMLGDGNGNVMPGRTISVNEAMTMALRAIGYTANSAQLVGVWPANYVTLAQNNDLYDDVANVAGVDKASAAQIIYNLLTVQKVSVNSDGETVALWQDAAKTKASCLLNTGLGADTLDAQVIAGDEDATINLMPYVGAFVVPYEKNDKIIAIGEVKSTFLDGEFDADHNYFTANDVDYKGMTTATALYTTGGAYFLNGEARPSAGIDKIDDVSNSSITIAVDLSNKTIKALYSIAEWDWTAKGDAAVVDAADLEAIDDQELLGSDFILNDNDEIDLNSFQLVGAASLDKIAKDNVVYVYANSDNEIKKIAVGTKVVTGKVTEKDGSKYVINGTKYEFASTPAAGNEIPSVGDTVTAKLDYYGDIFDCDVDGGTADTYGIIKYHAAAGINDEQVKLYTSADATTTFDINSDATVSTNSALTTIGGIGNLVGYALDKDGDIDTINLQVVTRSAATLASVSVLNTDDGSYAVNSDAVVFTKDASNNYGVTTVDKVKTGTNLVRGTFQMILDGDDVVAMLIDENATGKSEDDTYGVFNKVTEAVNADDDAVQHITGYANSASFDKYTDDESDITPAFDATTVAAYKIEIGSDGVVTKVTGLDADTLAGTTIGALNSAKTAVEVGGTWYALADNVQVYRAELNDNDKYEYSVSSTTSLRETYKVYLYDTDPDNDGYEVVIFVK